MRWRNVIILVIVSMLVQASLHRLVGLGPQRLIPDLLFMMAVVLVFRGAYEQTLVAGWILGLAKDIITDAPLGAYALAFGIVVCLILKARELLYRGSTLALMLVTFLGAVLVEEMVLMVSRWRGQNSPSDFWRITAALVLGALLTAAIAPYGQWLLLRLRYWLGWSLRKGYGVR